MGYQHVSSNCLLLPPPPRSWLTRHLSSRLWTLFLHTMLPRDLQYHLGSDHTQTTPSIVNHLPHPVIKRDFSRPVYYFHEITENGYFTRREPRPTGWTVTLFSVFSSMEEGCSNLGTHKPLYTGMGFWSYKRHIGALGVQPYRPPTRVMNLFNLLHVRIECLQTTKQHFHLVRNVSKFTFSLPYLYHL